MPTTVNGIGTQYYGRRNLSQRNGVCQSCRQYGSLVSYDTRLWFVVIFIPIIPLGRKRIMDECSRCRRHFVADADKYEANKQLQISGSLDEYRRSPSPENALQTHAGLLAFRDFDQAEHFRQAASAKFPEHAALHAGLADQLEQFAGYHEATPFYEKALAIDPDLYAARVGVARRRMVEGKLDEARELLDFLEVPGAGQQHSLGPLDILAGNYQRAGRHEEALELASHLLSELPDVGQQYTFRAFVKKSEKALGAEESILPPVEGAVRGLFRGTDSPHPGWVRTLFWTGVVSGLILAGLFASSEFIRRNRTIHIVNATGKAVQVRLDDAPPTTVDAGLGKLTAAEGRHRVEISGPVHETVDLDMAAGFFDRFLSKPAWVINPGSQAVLDDMTVHYAANPQPNEHRLVAGESVTAIPHVDYLFEDPPNKMRVKGRNTVINKRALNWVQAPAAELFEMLLAEGGRPAALTFAEGQLRSNPGDQNFLRQYVQQVALGDAERVAKFLETGLDRRPLDIPWHRAYESTVLAAGHDTGDLVARYDRALAEEPGNAGLLYLRGRLEPNFARREPYYKKAVQADPKQPWPWFALGMQANTEGRWQEGLVQMRKARELGIPEDEFRDAFHVARLALGEAKTLVGEYRSALTTNPMNMVSFVRLCDALVIAGEPDQIASELNAWIPRLPSEVQGQLWQPMRSLGHYQSGKLSLAEDLLRNHPEVAASSIGLQIRLAAGKAKQAVTEPAYQKLWGNPWNALAAAVALRLEGAEPQASELLERTRRAMAGFGKLFADERSFLNATEPPPVSEVIRTSIDPEEKTLVLCELAQRFPAKRAEYLDAAGKFNISRKPPYLLVKRVMDQKPAAKKP
ncbi:tetratricopeptide repeat protein [Aquisphaera insulae]|uniref:tetratricopeptide repeat protein n=1 Tax=Aquisphaera insulae TaxID=2712864 RepID=UPI0013ECE537|nr:hypothetical protein [Aquisphaera insulae]